MPDEWDNYAVKPDASENDDWDQYAVKKKVSGQESKNTPKLSNSGGLNGLRFPLNTPKPEIPTVLVGKEKEKAQQANQTKLAERQAESDKLKGYNEAYRAAHGEDVAQTNRLNEYKDVYRNVQGDTAADAIYNAPPVKSSVVTERVAPLMTGLNNLTSGFYKIPRFVYDAFAMPQNLASDMLGMPELKSDYDRATRGTVLELVDRVGDFSKEEGDKWEAKKQKFDAGITDQLANGDYASAGLQVLDNVVESAPMIASIYLTGGAANASKLGSVSRAIGNALPFASMQNQELQGNSGIPDWLKPVNASLNGLSEILLEEKFGTKAILDGITRQTLNEGRERAVKSTKDFILSYAKKALRKVQPITDVVGNGLEEGATAMAQNIVAKATGEDPNRGFFDGVTDGMIVGSAQGTAATAARGGIDYILKPDKRAKVTELEARREALSADLDNPDLPETVKEKVADKVVEVNEQINDVLDANRAETANATPEQIAEVQAIEEELTAQMEALNSPGISEDTKTILVEDVKTLEKELKTKIKEAANADEITSPAQMDVGEQVGDGQGMGEGNTQGEVTSEIVPESPEAPLAIERLSYEEEATTEMQGIGDGSLKMSSEMSKANQKEADLDIIKSTANSISEKAKSAVDAIKKKFSGVGYKEYSDDTLASTAAIELEKELPSNVYFHGTDTEIDQIDLNEVGKRDFGNIGSGFYISKSPRMSQSYAEAATKKSGKKPLLKSIIVNSSDNFIDANEANDIVKKELGITFPTKSKEEATKVRELILGLGYDGVVLADGKEIAVFNPKAIQIGQTYNGLKDLLGINKPSNEQAPTPTEATEQVLPEQGQSKERGDTKQDDTDDFNEESQDYIDTETALEKKLGKEAYDDLYTSLAKEETHKTIAKVKKSFSEQSIKQDIEQGGRAKIQYGDPVYDPFPLDIWVWKEGKWFEISFSHNEKRGYFDRRKVKTLSEAVELINNDIDKQLNRGSQIPPLSELKKYLGDKRAVAEQGEPQAEGVVVEEDDSDEGSSTYDNEIVVLDESKIVYPEDTAESQKAQKTPTSEIRESISPDSAPVLSKAEDDLTALKKVANKAVKYEASMRRLSEAKNAGLITEAEFDTTKLRFDDVMAESSGKAGDSLRKLADKIDKGRISKPGQFTASTGFDAVWDGSLIAVSASLRAGAKVADAIEAGLAHVRETDWYKNLKDKTKFEDTYRSHMASQLKEKNIQVPEGKGSWRSTFNNTDDIAKKNTILETFATLPTATGEELRDIYQAAKETETTTNRVNWALVNNKNTPQDVFDDIIKSKALERTTSDEAIQRVIGTRNGEKTTPKAAKPKTEPAPKPEKPAPATPGMEKRAATQRVLNSDKYSQEFKDALTEKTIHYKELPNKVTDAEAEAIIDTQGETEAIRATSDFNNGMPSAVRFAVLQKLIDKLEARGENLQAAELAEELYSKATDYGQGIQIFSTFPKLTKTANVAYAKKLTREQWEALAKRAKPITTKIAKEFKKANEEAAEETVKAVKKSVEKATKVTSATTITDLPAGYGTRNKIFTRDKYLKSKMNLRKSMHSFALGVPLEDIINIAGYHLEGTGRDFTKFTRRMRAELGAKIKPYLKDIYSKTREELIKGGYDASLFLSDKEIDEQIAAQEGEVFKLKLEKAIAKKSAKEQREAIAKLQQISKEEGVWGQYRQGAASRLKSMVKTNIQTDIAGDPSLQQFTDGLVKNMRQKMKELLPEQPKTKTTPRPDIEIIGDAYKNFERYKEVWEQTQKQFQEKFADSPDILESIDAYFGEILDKPFSDRIMESAVRKGLKDMDKTIADLVVQHYTVIDHARESLRDKLINEAGLGDADASSLSREIERKFDEIATKKKQQILDRMFSKKTRKANQARGVDTELIKLTNLGGFSNAAIVEAYGEKMGWPKLTQENIQRIELLSDIIQNTQDPINKRRATEDLLAYQASLKGTSPWDIPVAVWYANVLSGYRTQEVNMGWNIANTGLQWAVAVAQNPKDARFITRGLLDGFLKRGWLEAGATFKTGYSPIKTRPEVPSLLERVNFRGGSWNPGNYLKYVRRIMVAADVLAFEGQNEMRAYQMARIEARKEGKLDPTLNQVDRAIELIGRASGQLEAIENKYEGEFNAEVENINAQKELTDKEKKSFIKALEADKQRKIFDAVEQQRSSAMLEESRQYAAEGTLNFPPRGLLGAVAHGINGIIENVPGLRYAVPFTNIIANAANIAVDYSPIGFLRLRNGGTRLPFTNLQLSKFRREDLTDQQRADLMTKAIIATGLMAATMLLSQPLGDDDEPILEITSNGTGDYAKNETMKKEGWQQYSIRVKLPSGKYSSWYSYQYTPLIFTLGFVGHFNDLLKYKKTEDEDSIVARLSKAAGLATTTLFDATYLSGLGDLLNTLLDPRSSGGTIDKTVKGVTNAIRGLIMPNLITQATQDLERVFDVSKKEIKSDNYVKELLGRTLQDIPYARNIYYDKINILGEPIMYDTDKFESGNTPDKIISLLVDKKAVFAPMNRSAVKIYDVKQEKERILTDEEFYNYSKEKGAYIKKVLTEGYDKYAKMSEDGFKAELTKIKTSATKIAKALIGDIPATTLEIRGASEGDDTVYSLSPEQIRRRLQLIDVYIETNKSAYDSKIDLLKDAQNDSKDQMLYEGYGPDAEGKFKLEIKE